MGDFVFWWQTKVAKVDGRRFFTSRIVQVFFTIVNIGRTEVGGLSWGTGMRMITGMTRKAQLPQELEARLVRQFGSAARGIFVAFEKKRLPTFRVNTLRSDDRTVMDACRERGIAIERVPDLRHAFVVKNKTERELLESEVCRDGHIYLQGLTSMLPPIILDPKPSALVLDLCAAPGSKTSQLAAMMGNSGEIVAVEQDAIRCQKLAHTLAMQGAVIVKVMQADAAIACKQWPTRFDAILADVPCSAEGRINVHDPRSTGSWSQKNITAHAKMQRRLLRAAVPCLKPGGRLVYSTCTLASEENEEMMRWLMTEFPHLKPVPFPVPLTVKRAARPVGTYVLPTERHEGMYVALLQRTNAG